jgi:hypothetical protein
MSDQNLKKVLTPAADLPGFGAVDGGYTVRYRIITEDRNQISEWSPLYFFPTENEFVNVGENNASLFVNDPAYVNIFGVNKVLNIFWNDLSSFAIRQYDIFINLNGEYSITAVAQTNTNTKLEFTSAGHGLIVGSKVQFSGVSGITTVQEVTDITENTFKVEGTNLPELTNAKARTGNNQYQYQQTTIGSNYANIGLGRFSGNFDVRVLIQTPQKKYEDSLVLFKTSAPITLSPIILA